MQNTGLNEFHFDGLRWTPRKTSTTPQQITSSRRSLDASRDAAGGRATFLVAENEPQHSELVRGEDQGGFGLDALWNDDFHHIARVVLSGHNEAYYADYRGAPQEFISAVKIWLSLSGAVV